VRRRRVDIEREAALRVGNRGETAADVASALARKDRRLKALELRVFGGTYDQIAKELGVSPRQVKKDVARALREHGAEKVDQMRAIANRRLEADYLRLRRAISKTQELAEDGDTKAAVALASLVRASTGIIESITRLNGCEVSVPQRVQLDARIEHAGTVRGALMQVVSRMSDEDYAELVERARERRLALVPPSGDAS
jgi:DNA-binding CsgD family transcriptional regulator